VQRKVEVIMEGLSTMHVIVGLNSMAYPCQPKSVSGATPAIFYPIRLKNILSLDGRTSNNSNISIRQNPPIRDHETGWGHRRPLRHLWRAVGALNKEQKIRIERIKTTPPAA
jgi:hypothetical protein